MCRNRDVMLFSLSIGSEAKVTSCLSRNLVSEATESLAEFLSADVARKFQI
jgi:hypothetical protein